MGRSMSNRQGLARLIIAVVVFGSIWGLLEATLGGFLNLVVFPNKGAIMGGIGMAIMGVALAKYRKPAMLPFIGIVAASFKMLNVFILFINPLGIVGPVAAIIAESAVTGLVAVLLIRRVRSSSMVNVGAGALVGILAAVAWIYFAVYGANLPVLARMGVSSVGGYISSYGVVQAVFYGVFLPVGYLLGEKLAAVRVPGLSRWPVYYAASAGVVVFCWGISALAVAAGL